MFVESLGALYCHLDACHPEKFVSQKIATLSTGHFPPVQNFRVERYREKLGLKPNALLGYRKINPVKNYPTWGGGNLTYLTLGYLPKGGTPHEG